MKKRFLSIVLAVLMLLSVMPVTAMAADRTTVNTAQNGIEATKTAKWVDKKEGIAEITITVKGEPPEVSTPEVDAVLVIDLSGSMNDNNKLNDAKAAAKKFVDKFFGKDAPASYKKSVRIAVVGYNGYAKAYADLTEAKDADALYTLFGSGYGSLSAGGGTNIQDGIYRAQQILKNGRAGAKKVMVVLSDGEPTYSFDANVAHTFGQNEETYGVKKNNFLYVVSEIDHTDRVGSGSAYATGAYHYYYYCKDDKNVQQYYYVQNHGVGTVSEAYWAKKDGTTIYSIGFGISQYESGGYGLPQRETDVYKVAQSLASDDKKFKLAKDGGELGNVFDGIANEVAKYTAYNPTVIDTMGKNFEVVSNSLPTDKKVTLKSDGSLEWDITDGELDTTEHKLTFQVKYDKTKLTDDEMLLTNGEAKLIYSKTEGGEQNQEQPITSGQVENLAFTVTYLDETGTELTAPPYTKTRYWYGDTVAIEKGPVKTGYDFTVWTVTGVTPAEGAKSFDMPKNNVTLKANYTPTAAPALTITKTAYRVNSVGSRGAKLNDTDTVKSGDKIEYDLTVKNTGDVTLSMIEVRDDFQGKGTLYVDGEAKEADWKYLIGALHPDDDISYSGAGKITYTVTEADVAAGTIVNKATATVSYEGQEIKAEATHTLNAAEPTTMDITITKIWDDSVPTDRDRSVRIWLYANGEQDKYFYAKKGAGITDNTTTGTIPDRPVKDADGKDIEYTVKETEINGQAVTSDNQLVTADEIWTGVVTGDAETGFTVTNSVRKNERRDAEVTKTATRTRGNAEPVPLPQTGGTVREGDIITYTVKVKNKGNVAFSAGDWARDYFTAAGTLVGEDGNIQGGGFGGIIGFSTLQPDQFIEKQYTYQVLAEDEEKGYIANVVGVQVSIPGSMNPLAKSVRHEVTVEKPHSVTYTFENNDGLPTEVQTLLPTQDTKKYYAGDSVTLPTLTETTKQVGNTTYTFAGWHVDGVKVTGSTYTMGDKDVTFVGKWNSVTVNPKYKLSYVFKSGDDTITTLPQGVLNKKPADSDEVEAGTDVTLPSGFTTVHDDENGGTWTFEGWYTDDNLSAESKITGDTYPMPEGGKTLYGKWTFEADKPEITEAGYTVEYYRQNADGENYTLQEDTDSGVAEIGKEKTIEPAEDKYSGYTYNETESIVTLTIQEEEDKNVFKVYYDAVPGLAVTKTITDVTRDGEPLNPDNPEVEVKEGDVIEYEITVRNSGKLNLTDIVLTDEFTGAEGDLTFISGDDYTVDGYEITLKNDLNVGDSVTIKATYEVQLGDSGYEITNKASGTAKDALKREVTGESRPVGITPDALKAYRIFGSVYKYIKSEKGTFNKDEETVPFEFKVTSDKKGEEILDTFTIDVEETVKAGETSEGDWGGFDFNLSEEEFENLDKKEFNGKEYPVVYLWELKGDLKNMSYSTKRITLYLDRPNISYYSAREPMVEYLGRWMAYADPDKGADADIINIYGKQSSSGGTVKVGPQLNRDDHVAYIMGYPDGTVQPEGEITRAEACTIFFRLLTESSRNYYFSKTNDYTDVNAGDWFNNAISTLSNAGIVTGYNDGTFRPNQPITRGEMAKIIANFANLNKGTKSFTDLSGHWSKSYVELAAGNGWIAGYPDGSFRPDQKITRAETVTMINRVLERVPAKELRLLSRSIMLTFPDNNPGDWYYIAIQEASNSHEYQRSVYETTGDEMWTKLIDNVDWTKLEK